MSLVEILIADDHELFRRTLRTFLQSQPDFRVCGEAGDGIEAVEKIRQLRPDLVLMDINMPRMDGLEATRIIRREIPDCNVILVTQNHATIAREQARSVDARGSVTKSDLSRDLLPTIQRVIGNSKPGLHQEPEEESPHIEKWVRAGGALGKLVDEFDWSKTPLGPREQWSQSLKTIVRVMLTSRFAMWMSWGPELTFLYNDAYAKMTLGKKHPWALGKPSQKVWEEIWSDIGPLIHKVLESGQSTWDEALLLFLERSGYREETYHTFSYSPLSGDDGKVEGHLCVVTEETDRIIGDRRLQTLRTLSAELSKTITEEDVVASVSRVLRDNPQDLPFTLTYLVSQEDNQARLRCRTGLDAGHPAAPEVIKLTENGQTLPTQIWPIDDLLRGRDSVLVEDLAERFEALPSGAWDRAPARALVLPIASQTQAAPAGVLVAALNPYRPLDVSYAGFLRLIAGQIAASIANARAYEEEKKRAEALAEIDRAKTLFFSNVSHEFRTPLTLMLAPLEDLLSESRALSPHQHERLDIAHRNSLRLLKLVNTLLDFSRIEAGRFQASYEQTDLAQLTSELASVFRSAIERAGLRLLVHCPSLDEPVYVDRELWEKIVFNLLSNAFKFTFEGEIEVSVRKSGAGAELVVRDTGTGIPTDELPHLFERFYRVKNARGRTFEGSGIGLALVQELAKQHGGTVQVQSEIGEGTSFKVTIPFGKDHLPADRIGARRTLTSTTLSGETYVDEVLHWLPEIQGTEDFASASTLVPSELLAFQTATGRSRILLADDNADMREYIRKLLSPVCEVEAVSDGQAALEAARAQPPDLVLTDVMMPKLDGFGLLKELRSDHRTVAIPVIMLSARAGEESRIEGLGAGADDYLVKPFSARELLARITSHLNMARIRREAAEVERKLRAEAELERSRLRELFMQAPAAIGVLSGPDHRYSFVNAHYLKVTGRERVEDFEGKTLYEALPELVGQGLLEILDGVYSTGVPYVGSARKVIVNRGPKGQPDEVYFDFIYQPLRNTSGQVEGILVHGVDVTQQVLARKEIEKREQQFREMIDALPAAVYTTDAKGRITHFNPAAVEFAGRTPQLGVDQWCVTRKLFLPNGTPLPHDQCPMAIALKEGPIIDGAECIAERPDGKRVWFTPYPRPLRDSYGKIIGGINMLVDITARRQAEQALRESEQRYRVITDASPIMVWMAGLDKRCFYFNKVWLDFVGRTLEQEAGNGWAENVHPDDFDRCLQLYVSNFDARRPFEMQYRLKHHSGQYRWIVDRGVPRYAADGTFEGYVGACLDIHDQKETEEKARRADVSFQLMKSQDEERRHIARELHDTAGQTLTVLGINLAQVIQKVGRNAPAIATEIANIQETVQQLHREIRTASYLLHPPLLDESGLYSAIGWYVEGLLERSGLEVRLDISEEFGRLPRDLELVIFRLVQESLTNIHRHADSKTASIRMVRESDQIMLEIRDQGRGMSAARLGEVRAGRSGVGIRGMRERIRQFDGTLRIESDNSGTRVIANIPVPKAALSDDQNKAEPLTV